MTLYLIVSLILRLLLVGSNAIVGASASVQWTCGTKSSPSEVNSILDAQRKVFGKALYEIENSTARFLATRRLNFPKDVELKVKVVNCAQDKFKGFDKSLGSLNNGFKKARIKFSLHPKIEICTSREAERLKNTETDIIDLSDSISQRVAYSDGPLFIVFPGPGGGRGEVGLMREFPWIYAYSGALIEGLSENCPACLYNHGAEIHEMGHYLGLLHPFENGCSFPGDYIPDTPYEELGQATSMDVDKCCEENQGSQHVCRELTSSSCGGPVPDAIDNYMGYNAHQCQNPNSGFTDDQIAVMQATLMVRRPSWIGKDASPSLNQESFQYKLKMGENIIKGGLSDGTFLTLDDLALRSQNCPKTSIWAREHEYSFGLLEQPLKLVYRLSFPTDVNQVLFRGCKISLKTGSKSIFTVFLCDKYNHNCQCFVKSCIPEDDLQISSLNSVLKGGGRMFLVFANEDYSSNEGTFSINVGVEKGGPTKPSGPTQPPPENPSTGSLNDCTYASAGYTFESTHAPCRGHFIVAEDKCNTVRVSLEKVNRETDTTGKTLWGSPAFSQNVSISSGNFLTTLNSAARMSCKEKYLKASKGRLIVDEMIQPSLWLIKPIRKDACDEVAMMYLGAGQNDQIQYQQILVDDKCTLRLEKKESPASTRDRKKWFRMRLG